MCVNPLPQTLTPHLKRHPVLRRAVLVEILHEMIQITNRSGDVI